MSDNTIYGYCRISTRSQSIERQERNIKAEYPAAVIVKEVFTGTKIQGRKGLDSILKNIKTGDTIVFDSVSRMSRDAEEGFKLYQELFEKNVSLVFLKEPHINTDTYQQEIEKQMKVTIKSGDEDADILMNGMIKLLNDYTMALARRQIRLAFNQAEKEVEDLHQRTKEGIQTARLSGKQIGGVTGKTLNIHAKEPIKELIRKYSKTFDGNLEDKDVMSLIRSKTYTEKNQQGKDEEKKLSIARNTYYKYKKEMQEEIAGV